MKEIKICPKCKNEIPSYWNRHEKCGWNMNPPQSDTIETIEITQKGTEYLKDERIKKMFDMKQKRIAKQTALNCIALVEQGSNIAPEFIIDKAKTLLEWIENE